MSQRDVPRVLERAISIDDLLDEIEHHRGTGKKVLIISDYGDHSHTQQALPIERISTLHDEGEYLYDSGYSNSRIALHEGPDGEDEYPEGYEDREDCIIIRA